jgi:hypothetical protein
VGIEDEKLKLKQQHDDAKALFLIKYQIFIDTYQRIASSEAKHLLVFNRWNDAVDDKAFLKLHLLDDGSLSFYLPPDAVKKEYSDFKNAYRDVHRLNQEKEALDAFVDAYHNLNIQGELINGNIKTQRAVTELLAYIDAQNGKPSWCILLGALTDTYDLLTNPKNKSKSDLFRFYELKTMMVQGGPSRQSNFWKYWFLPSLSLGLIWGFVNFGLEYGFLSGGLLNPAVGIGVCIALLLALLCFAIYERQHTVLSKKMLHVLEVVQQCEHEKEASSERYKERKDALITQIEQHAKKDFVMPMIKLIDAQYKKDHDSAQAGVLLTHLESMLKTTSQSELKQIEKDFKHAAQGNMRGCCCLRLFLHEPTELEKNIQCLTTLLKDDMDAFCAHRAGNLA